MKKKCLEEYVSRTLEPSERKWRSKHIELLISHVRQFDNFKLFVTKIPSAFTFFIKYNSSMDAPERIFITGRDISQIRGKISGQIVGYFTGNLTIIEQFNREVKILEENAYKEFLNRKKLISFLEQLIK